jgi:hypothetical protein
VAEHKVPVNINMTSSVRAQLIDLSKETGVPMATLVERGLLMLFAAGGRAPKPEMVDVKLPVHVARELAEALRS